MLNHFFTVRFSKPAPKRDADEMEELVLEVARDYSLDVAGELDEVGVKYLGTYVNAQASKEGSNFRIDFDSTNFFNQSEERQRRTILHELIHIKQFNNSLSDWACNEFDVSDEVAEKLDGTIWEDVRSVEGETELLLSTFFPEQESTYPYAQSRKETEFEGIDLEDEIGIDEDDHSIYREIEEITVEDNIYIEEGTLNGEDYSVAVMSDYTVEEGFQKAQEYIQNEIANDVEYGPENQADTSSDFDEYMHNPLPT